MAAVLAGECQNVRGMPLGIDTVRLSTFAPVGANGTPLAVDDVVLMRTLTGLTAVDFRTGKRVWRGADDEFAEDLLTRESPLARGRGGGRC